MIEVKARVAFVLLGDIKQDISKFENRQLIFRIN